MHDYQQILTELQRRVAEKYLEDSSILNVPGLSSACKIDPLYYLVLQPSFFNSMAKWSGFSPGLIQETLIRTGNLIRLAGQDTPFVSLSVKWDEVLNPVRVKAGFVLSDFLDKGLKIYARTGSSPPVSDLVIQKQERGVLDDMFQGKTPLNNLAFG